jgi:uncharacterized delta-60 repeat protein
MKKILTTILTVIALALTSFAQPGSLDLTFNQGIGANENIRTSSVQSDGKIIIGGWFTSYNGTVRNKIARLNTDGTVDITFNPGTGANISIENISLQADGKIIICGDFTTFNGTSINYITRLNANGTLDASFNIGTGANNFVYSSAIQNDGKIIVGGNFTSYNGTVRNRIARLNTDGTLDVTFVSGAGANDWVYSNSIQNDGKIIVGGNFTSYNGTARNYIARLNSDGTLDASFNTGTGANNIVHSSAIQSDGKIIICGNFTSYNGTPRNRIARLNNDGTLDASFNIGTGANSYVKTASIQSDGKIIISGDFTNYNGVSRSRIARLNTDGTLDVTFVSGAGANDWVYTNCIQNDGKIIIGGSFTSYNGTARNRIARIVGGGCISPISNITPSGATTFCQGGNVILTSTSAANYLWSTNETTQSITVSTSGNYSVTVTDGNGCSATSSSMPVTVNPLPTATITPSGATTFCQGNSVTLTSSAATSYLWSTGEITQSITVSNAGTYLVTNTNSCGSVTSNSIVVNVNPAPTANITAQSGTTFCIGGSVTLNANTASSLTYVWKNNNTIIADATSASYTASTSGSYTVEVTNSSNCSATSTATIVTVNNNPSVSLAIIPSFININAIAQLLSGTPTGGAYNGTGIVGNSFYPQTAGLGIHNINYIYTDINGCSASASQNTIVYDTLGIICTTYDTTIVIVNDTNYVTAVDTNFVTVTDTSFITVTDTLVINALLTGIAPPNNVNTIKIFPNPTSDHITIYYGNFSLMNGYTLKIENSIGQTVFTTPITQQSNYIDLSNWTGNGIYFVHVIDDSSITIDIRKIVLQ